MTDDNLEQGRITATDVGSLTEEVEDQFDDRMWIDPPGAWPDDFKIFEEPLSIYPE
jgi:hypothetical protein